MKKSLEDLISHMYKYFTIERPYITGRDSNGNPVYEYLRNNINEL